LRLPSAQIMSYTITTSDGHSKGHGNNSKQPFTSFPDKLVGNPFPDDAFVVDNPTTNTTDQDTQKTIFFVNMPPDGLQGTDKAKLGDIQQNVLDFQCWASHLASITVQSKIDSGDIEDDKVALGSYRAKVMDWILNNKTTWLAKTSDQNSDKQITVRKADFHTQILVQALQGITVPSTVLKSLDQIVSAIGDGIITASLSKSSSQQQFWIMLTYYTYFKETGTFQTIVRTIGFKCSDEASKYMLGKSSIEKIDFRLQFSGAQFDFNNRTYEGIKDNISREAIEDGKKMINDKSAITVPI